MRARGVIALIGAVVGTLCDHLHVAFDVLGYPAPDFWGQAWWVPPLYGSAALGLFEGHRLFVKVPRLVGRCEAVVVFSLFIAAYATTAVLADRPVVVLLVLTAPWVVYVYLRGSRRFVAYALGTAAVGVAVECVLQALGLFAYKAPVVWRVPVWLPALYLWGAALGAAMHGVVMRFERPDPA